MEETEGILIVHSPDYSTIFSDKKKKCSDFYALETFGSEPLTSVGEKKKLNRKYRIGYFPLSFLLS